MTGSAPAAATLTARRDSADGKRIDAETALVGVVVALAVLVLLPGPYTPGSYGDDGTYLALGKALASGSGYRSIQTVGAPYQLKFPPLYPALLSIFWRLTPDPYAVVRLARIANASFVGGAAALLWRLGRRSLAVSPVLLIAFVLGPLLLDANLHLYALALTEPLFLLLWAACLLQADRLWRGAGRAGESIALGVMIAAAVLTRTQAVFLLLAAPVLVTVDRRRAAMATVTAVAPVLAWQAVRLAWVGRGGSAGTQGSYFGEIVGRGGVGAALKGMGHSALINLRAYPGVLAPYLGPGVVGRICIAALVVVGAFGAFRLWHRAPFLTASLFLNGLLIVAWPNTADRLALSALPVLGLAAAYRVELDLRRAAPALRRAASVVLLVTAALIAWRQVWLRGAERGEPPSFYTSARLIAFISGTTARTADWVAANTDSSETVLLSWPEGVYLLTGRRTVNADPPVSRTAAARQPSAAELARRLSESHVSVVVVAAREYRSAADVERIRRSCPGFLRPVASLTPSGYPAVYRVSRDDPKCRKD